MAGLVDQTQESVKIALAQGSYLFCHAVVIGIDMEGAQHGTVAALLATLRKLCKESLKRHIPQHFAAAHSSHGAALGGHSGIFVGQVGMICAGIQNAQGKACLGEIHGHRLHIRVGRVRKINGNNVANAGSHLIHQAAGLAKVDVLCPLADLRDLDGGDFIGHEAVIQDHADQHFKGGGGRNAAALGHVGGNVHIQTGQLCAALTEGFAFAAQQREGSVFLFLAGSKVIKADHTQVVAFALHAQLVQGVGRSGSDHINIHAAGQHAAMLVVGVVAADLGAAGGTVKTSFSMGAKGGIQTIQNSFVAGSLCRSFVGRTAVKCCQPGSVSAAGKLLLPCGNRFHHRIILLLSGLELQCRAAYRMLCTLLSLSYKIRTEKTMCYCCIWMKSCKKTEIGAQSGI